MRLTLAVSLLSVHALVAQTAATAPSLTLEQREEFIKKAELDPKHTHGAKKGITGTVRATLSDGVVTHDVSIQRIDEEKARFETPRGVEINFRDTYKFNIAAYRLGKMLGLEGMIPPSVERSYQGTRGAWTWWVDDVLMDDVDRTKKKVFGPDKDRWSRQYLVMKVFDQLIANTDRNQQNILYTKDWSLWMIDHTRAFRTITTLLDEKALERCDRVLLAKMKELNLENLKAELGAWIRPMEIKGILARRDKIVAHFEKTPDRLYDLLPSPKVSRSEKPVGAGVASR